MVLIIFFVLAILHTNLLVFFSGQTGQAQAQSTCLNNGNYTRNSTYANNLNTILSAIPDNIDTSTGFYNASAGQAPDRANVIALCRGDVQPTVCRGCIRNTTAELLTSCPNQRQAAAWSEFCMLRFSNQTLYGIMAPSPPGWFLWNTENATNPTQFMLDLRTLIDSLRGQAAEGGPRRKVAAGNATATNFQYIFALVQCTPDLTSEDCSRCLIGAAQDIPRCCDSRRGARVLWPSCNIRYETALFYNSTRLQELEPVPPAPAPAPPPPVEPQSPPPPPSGGANNTTTTVIIVVASLAGSVLLAVFACVLFRKRTKRKPKPEERDQNDDISSTVESLKYSLSTIRSATNDFSDDNKLGQGGFGAVYKAYFRTTKQ